MSTFRSEWALSLDEDGLIECRCITHSLPTMHVSHAHIREMLGQVTANIMDGVARSDPDEPWVGNRMTLTNAEVMALAGVA